MEEFPNRGPTTIAVCIITTVLSIVFGVWRLIVRWRTNRKFAWSDYWIMVALPLATVGHMLALLGAVDGEGRLDRDPFLNPDQVALAKKWMFFHRCFNLYAMLFAKLSICCYVLTLNFSKTYRITIWISMGIIIVNLGLLPGVGHWAQCHPLHMRWDSRVKGGKCFGGNQFKFALGYIQTVTNVVTDVLYAAAPILYLRRVQLSRYTRVGVQGVFLCSLLGTGVSVGKLIEFRRSYGNKDELYKASTSTMLNVAENSIAIIVACLPPLRRTFDDLFKAILPESFLTKMGATHTRSRTHELPQYYNKSRTKQVGEDAEDDESERAILPTEEYIEDGRGKIIRTTKVVITNEANNFSLNGKGVQ
ncbi:uncharacterized protein EI97DRAFT_17226 [Westerdykella ornata]|uniref:Rhodopsin domain-containing protein n=1 Tax=Westerdykella ornata TaxID=318751 RepID=A0A6A6JXR4_WESOR|nr:uncharacterized protein EI97DRAFT_17226 [Westerdykella ornata]KAF2280984.1 hypothetical protein EI97DRAFT_17226 [Westerdykella ornata]